MRSISLFAAALFAVVLVAFAPGAGAQTAPTFTVSPTSGEGSVTPIATWNVPGASSCTASGGWSGSKAASGTETLPAIVRNTTYSLTCSTGTGSVALTWTRPDKRTDGSALTNLAGFRIYHGTSPSALSSRVDVTNPALSTFVVENLAPGTRHFAMTSVDANGLESLRTSVVNAPVSAGSIVLPSATVTVQSLPNSPTGLTVQPVIAGLDVSPVYRILRDGSRGEQVAGFIGTGAQCTGRVVFTYRGQKYRRVDPKDVTWWGTRATTDVAGPCA